MDRPELTFDPYENDPSHWGVSMAQMTELIVGCLDAVGARSVAELGAFAGDLTRVLADWAQAAGAKVLAVDPAPQPGLVALAEQHPGLELIRQTSLAALPEIPLPNAVVIDGDHNYYTVSHELAAIADRASGAALPLLLFHDVRWPHGRRDDYFDASQIPEADRHPVAGDRGGLYPGDPGLRPGGLPYPRSAAREGGARNGVLTAVEDFVAGRPELRMAVVPAFFGFGAVWHRDTRGADQLSQILDPFDSHPVLDRLEANRVHHLAESQIHQTELWEAQERIARLEAVLQRLLDSSAFTVAEQLSRLRVRARVAPGSSVIAKDEIRRALNGGDR